MMMEAVMTLRFSGMPEAVAAGFRAGGSDGYGLMPERRVSDGDGVPCRCCLGYVEAGARTSRMSTCGVRPTTAGRCGSIGGEPGGPAGAHRPTENPPHPPFGHLLPRRGEGQRTDTAPSLPSLPNPMAPPGPFGAGSS